MRLKLSKQKTAGKEKMRAQKEMFGEFVGSISGIL